MNGACPSGNIKTGAAARYTQCQQAYTNKANSRKESAKGAKQTVSAGAGINEHHAFRFTCIAAPGVAKVGANMHDAHTSNAPTEHCFLCKVEGTEAS